jgi:hypothetical protein
LELSGQNCIGLFFFSSRIASKWYSNIPYYFLCFRIFV